MKNFLARLAGLILGLFLFAVGIVLMLQANIGYAPWDVLQSGLSQITGISFGIVSILVGFVILLVAIAMRQKIGLGTLFNMVLIGLFIDLIQSLNVVLQAGNWLTGLFMMLAGLVIIAFGSYFYIRTGFGAGPRDSLMVIIRSRTGWPVGVSRAVVEGSVALLGWMLGGPIGAGTLISAFGISACIHLVFSMMKFDPAHIEHESLGMTIQRMRFLKRTL